MSTEVSANTVVATPVVAAPAADAPAVSADLVVPPPLTRTITLKTPKNLSMILSICGEALKTYGDKEITSTNILILIQHIVTAANKIASVSVEEKKQIALESVHWLINHQKDLSDEEKATMDILSTTIFPQAVDMLTEYKVCVPSFACFSKQ